MKQNWNKIEIACSLTNYNINKWIIYSVIHVGITYLPLKVPEDHSAVLWFPSSRLVNNVSGSEKTMPKVKQQTRRPSWLIFTRQSQDAQLFTYFPLSYKSQPFLTLGTPHMIMASWYFGSSCCSCFWDKRCASWIEIIEFRSEMWMLQQWKMLELFLRDLDKF